jgi:hypothetical protein
MKRNWIVVVLALLGLAAIALPAASGGATDVVSAVSPKAVAKKALKIAKRADRRSKRALREAGKAGPAGPQGQQGPAGPVNISGMQTVAGPEVTLAAGTTGCQDTHPSCVDGSQAFCPNGTRAVSGGYEVVTTFGSGAATSHADQTRASWFAVAVNIDDTNTGTIRAFAYCAGSGQAVAARSRRSAARHEARAAIDKIEAAVAKRFR